MFRQAGCYRGHGGDSGGTVLIHPDHEFLSAYSAPALVQLFFLTLGLQAGSALVI